MTVPIAFTGKAESGKSTAADIVVANYGIPRFSFAEPIKSLCLPVLNARYGEGFQKPQARRLYQDVGQAMRDIDEDFWIQYLDWNSREFETIVIDDLRYENEAEWVFRKEGYVIRIERPEHQNALNGSQRGHPSEVQMDSIHPDYVLLNDGSQEEFVYKVCELIGGLVLAGWVTNV